MNTESEIRHAIEGQDGWGRLKRREKDNDDIDVAPVRLDDDDI